MDLVIGGGVSGLAAAAQLARAGRRVTLLEAGPQLGGFAGPVHLDALSSPMDGGPYILLDRRGLEWVFDQLGERLEDHLELLPIDETWRVCWEDGDQVRIYRDLDRTADELDLRQRGSGDAYRRFIRRMDRQYHRLEHFQRRGPPRPWQMLRPGRAGAIPFLLQPLSAHLERSGLDTRVQHALGIWTHIAQQPLDRAPAPLAFVPAIVHRYGAWVAKGGVWSIPAALAKLAERHGVQVRTNCRVDRIERRGQTVTAVHAGAEVFHPERVISSASGLSTLTELVDPPDPALNRELRSLPLQSPGVAAYLRGKADERVPFLRFLLPDDGPCRLFIHFGAVDPSRADHLRLLSPVPYDWSQDTPFAEQEAYLERILEEPWWRTGVSEVDILARRIPRDWRPRVFPYRDSMNPVMTAAFMRRGRLPHRSPLADNLFLTGSSTHPGQWVSFCAISGLIAAEAALSDG